MESTLSTTTFIKGNDVTLTVSDVEVDFPLVMWVINYTSSDLSKSHNQLDNEGRLFASEIESLTVTQTVSSKHSNITTLTPILIEAHNPAQGLGWATTHSISENEYTLGTTVPITYRWGDIVLSGIVNWVKQWFHTKEEMDTLFLTDSGWQTCSLNSGYSVYTSGTTLRVRKTGKIVQINGVFKNNSSVTSSITAVKFATIPTGYRPSKQQVKVCQGSNMSRWTLTVNSSGEMFWARYGTDSYATASSGSWLIYTMTYMID